MSDLKGLSAGVRELVSNENFRNGTQPAVEYEPYVVDLAFKRKLSLAPLRAVLEEGRKRHSTKWSDSDGWLAPRVHATLRLTRREAADRRLWAYLTVAAFPNYVRWRWLDPDDPNIPVPIDRFLGEDSKNHLARLWWGAELTRNGDNYARTEKAFRNSRFSVSWQVLDVMHHRPTALALVDFLEQFNDGKGATDSQGSRMARALNAALRTLALDAVADNPEPDTEAFREWIIEAIDETKMMDKLPKGPDEKEPISEKAIAEVRKHLDALAQEIGLGTYVRTKAAGANFDESLCDLIQARLLHAGEAIFMDYKEKRFQAVITANGEVECLGKVSTPSGAAVAVIRSTGSNRPTENGWRMWKTEEGATLRELRERLKREPAVGSALT